jgi:hypothetical protein
MASKQLTKKEQEAVLKSFHRVLRNKGIESPVSLSFAPTGVAAQRCLKWVCRTQNGKKTCGWEPC